MLGSAVSVLGSSLVRLGSALVGLGFALAGPLEIRIRRLSKSHQKTCQNKLHFQLFGTRVAQGPFRSFLVAGLHSFGSVGKAAWLVGLGNAVVTPGSTLVGPGYGVYDWALQLQGWASRSCGWAPRL